MLRPLQIKLSLFFLLFQDNQLFLFLFLFLFFSENKYNISPARLPPLLHLRLHTTIVLKVVDLQMVTTIMMVPLVIKHWQLA